MAYSEFLHWLERENRKRKTYVHRTRCGYGGERWLEKVPVDGFIKDLRKTEEVAGLGLVERSYAWNLQSRVRTRPDDDALFEMLLRRRP